jgi:adhesin transport system membrane fusion protein
MPSNESAKQPEGAIIPVNVSPPKKKKPLSSYFFYVITFFLILAIVWASIFKVHIASTALGEVMPSTLVKKVQHLEGGIINKIMVSEGEKVKKGQAILSLESTKSVSDLSQITLRIASLRVDIIRLKGELNNFAKIDFPDEIKNKHKQLVQQSQAHYVNRKERYKNELDTFKEQTIQKDKAVQEIKQRLFHINQELKLLEEQITISEDLLRKKITSRYTHLVLLRELKVIEGKIAQDKLLLQQVESALQEAKSNRLKFINTYREDLSKKLEETQRKLNEFVQQLSKISDAFKRTTLVSPVDGVVRQLYVFTAGGVIKPGETVADILPLGDVLVVDAKLPIQDIGYIRVGQKALIRLASADAMRFDAIQGSVSFISADAIDDSEGMSFYKVRVQTAKPFFKRGNLRYRLYPGMQVSVSIITGSRSIMAYILDPLLSTKNTAFRER